MATSNFEPDVGGGRGYSIAFTDKDAYASVQNYFTASASWPVKSMSISMWIRWTGVNGIRSWPFTVMAANDPNHIQIGLNTVQNVNNWTPNLQLFITQLTSYAPVTNLNSFSSCWTKVTITFNATDVSIYYNGTLASHAVGNGNPLRWTDTTAFFLGGYVQQVYMFCTMIACCVCFVTIISSKFHSPSCQRFHSTVFQQANDPTLVSATQSERFFGWMDDLAFYNRVLTVEEISKNWQQAIHVVTTDPSLFLYYNFDEGPVSTVITNHGTIGPQGDLYNGKVLGSSTYMDTASQAILPVKQGLFAPGVPVVGAPTSLPVVFAVDAGASARLRIACPLTTTTTTAASLVPSQAQLSLPSETGKIYQTDLSRTRITTPNTALTSAAAEFWYYASATTNSGSPIVDKMQYSCVCNGATQSGIINVIINPAVVPDQTISIVAVSGTTANFNLHGSLGNPGLMKVNITSLPTLGRLSQLDYALPKLATLISKVSHSIKQSQ